MGARRRWIKLSGLALVLTPSAGFAATPAEAFARCSAGVSLTTYLPTTCLCLQREIPRVHLVGKLLDGACPFQTPPPGFDPSKSSAETLASWGIPQSDAPALADPTVRTMYFHGVVREYLGQQCVKGVCGPGLATTWRPDDGASCDLPSELSYHCFTSHLPSRHRFLPLQPHLPFSAQAPGAAASGCFDLPHEGDVKDCLGKVEAGSELAMQTALVHAATGADETHRALLHRSQDAFIRYRDAECTFEGDATRGGTLETDQSDECISNQNRRRIDELNEAAMLAAH